MFLLHVLACKKVEPAPAELDDLFHWFWEQYDAGDDETLVGGRDNLHAAVSDVTEDEPLEGAVTDLTADEVALVGVDADPSLAAGIFVVTTFACAWGQLEEILSFGDQGELYEGNYESYARTFESPREDWLGDPASARLEYVLDYTTSVIGAEYTAVGDGVLHRVVPEEPGPAGGAFLVQRSVLPEPAEFEEGSNKTMDQDYQLEIYWSPKQGRIVHAYAMWRQADWGIMNSDDEGAQRLVLNGMLDWDKDTASLCEEGRP